MCSLFLAVNYSFDGLVPFFLLNIDPDTDPLILKPFNSGGSLNLR